MKILSELLLEIIFNINTSIEFTNSINKRYVCKMCILKLENVETVCRLAFKCGFLDIYLVDKVKSIALPAIDCLRN